MSCINIQDKQLTWVFNFNNNDITITDKNGKKVLFVYWADDFGLYIDDKNDDEFWSRKNVEVDFTIPADSIFYDICKNTIHDNYTIFSDLKPDDSKKRVEFYFTNEGMKIWIISDYKSEFESMASQLTFYGVCGGSNQEPEYKDEFIELIKGLIDFAKSKSVNTGGSCIALKK